MSRIPGKHLYCWLAHISDDGVVVRLAGAPLQLLHVQAPPLPDTGQRDSSP